MYKGGLRILGAWALGINFSDFNRHFSLDPILSFTSGIRRPCLLLYSLFVGACIGFTFAMG